MDDAASRWSPRAERAQWGVLGAAALAVLAIARGLDPDPSGMGTHVQLGLPPCSFLVMTGLPCPTCGLTTAFAYMARLEITHALAANAIGPVLFGLTLASVPLCAWGCATAHPLSDTIKRLRLMRLVAIIAAAVAVSWLSRLAAVLLP
jgi:hypothetical protein